MKRHLHLRVAVVVTPLIALIALFGAYISYSRSYVREIAATERALQQLGRTVEKTAAIAAYLDEVELARETVAGLVRNDIVAAVSLTSRTGLAVSDGSLLSAGAEALAVRVPLASPFVSGAVVGELVIVPRAELIEARAQSAAFERMPLAVFYVLLSAVAVWILVAWLVIRPLNRVARALAGITPGGSQVVRAPPGHEENEIGGLVRNVNALLALVAQQLERERGLRAEVESLGRRFRMIFEHSSAGIVLLGADGRTVMANPAFRAIAGEASQDACIGTVFRQSDPVMALFARTLREGVQSSGDFELCGADAEGARWAHCLFTRLQDEETGGAAAGAIVEAVINDVTERKRREQLIRLAAEHDPLTGLPNRRSAELVGAELLDKAHADQACVAVGLIDLDGFKPINDRHGHPAGDAVLIEVGRRLKHALRQSDLVARIGGDEFLIVLAVRTRTGAGAVAAKVLDELTRDIELAAGVRVRVGVSIGLALSSEHAADLKALIALADGAMYAVKRSGKGNFAFAEAAAARAAANA